jgi:hypothetical protein
MLEGLSGSAGRLTPSAFGALAFALGRPPRPSYLAEDAFGEFAHGRKLKPSGRAAGCFLSSINGVAKHFRDGGSAAKKMDLKTVRLFLGARLGVDAADIGF